MQHDSMEISQADTNAARAACTNASQADVNTSQLDTNAARAVRTDASQFDIAASQHDPRQEGDGADIVDEVLNQPTYSRSNRMPRAAALDGEVRRWLVQLTSSKGGSSSSGGSVRNSREQVVATCARSIEGLSLEGAAPLWRSCFCFLLFFIFL